MATRLNSARLLQQRRIPFATLCYDASRFHDAAAVADLLGVAPATVYKTLVLESASPAPGRPLLALIAADRELDLRRLAALTSQRKLRLVPRGRVEQLTGMQIGSISALALTHRNWPLWLDELARNHDEIHLSAGLRGQQLRLSVAALVTLTRARVATISRAPA